MEKKWYKYWKIRDVVDIFNILNDKGISPDCIKIMYSSASGINVYYYHSEELDDERYY